MWSDLREFRWGCTEGALVKVALTAADLPALYGVLQKLDRVQVHVSSGGNMAFISLPAADQVARLTEGLRGLALPAIALRGEAPLWCGAQSRPGIIRAVKQALDPENHFPGLDE